jgi:hypothetical protein
VCFAPFWPHVLNFWKRRNEPNILFLKYEDLKKVSETHFNYFLSDSVKVPNSGDPIREHYVEHSLMSGIYLRYTMFRKMYPFLL